MLEHVPTKTLSDAAGSPEHFQLRGGGGGWNAEQALARHKLHKHKVRHHKRAKAAAADARAGTLPPNEDIHIVFSTSCNEFQHWQTEVLLNTAKRVGQRGKITHIIAGCEEREDTGMEGKERFITHAAGAGDNIVSDKLWRKSSHPHFALHYAPSIPEAKEFPWFNKPWSFYHWMKTAKPKERVIVLLDPDEFFLEPLTQGEKKREDLINNWPSSLQHLVTDVVQPGMAVAQMYGFGAVWMRMFDRKKLCGAASYCSTISDAEANYYYPVGPPYLIHQQDFKPVMDLWWERFMKPAYAADKGDIQVDMYAYIMAAAHLKVKHVTLQQYMVSCPDCSGEGWAYVDAMKTMSCRDPAFPQGARRPGFIHAAQHYHSCSKGDTPIQDSCAAGSELWKHQQYIKSIEQPGTRQAVALPSAAAAPAGSSKALRKRKVCESPMYQALEQAKKLVNILEAVQEQQTLSDRQRQPILTQCQIIMQTVSEPGIKTEAAE